MKDRLLSVDVLRGMTIFFMILVNTPGSWSHVYPPLLHAKWHGCTPTDLVFPMFLFIAGVSMALSMAKSKGTNADLLKKLWKRAFLIFLVGVLLNWFPFYDKGIGELRIMGVLQRIALAYGIAGTIVVLLKRNGIFIASAFILIGYQLVLLLGGENPYSLEENLARNIDLWVFGENHLYGGFGLPFDPEGLLHSFPAAINVVLGFLIGKYMQGQEKTKAIKGLIISGAALVFAGLFWGQFFPINKPLWTSSYVLYTVGISTLLLAALVYIIDVAKKERWTYIFRVFGLNPLASYVLSGIFVKVMLKVKIGDTSLYGYLYKEVFAPVFGNLNGSLLFAITYVFFIWFFAFYLFRNNKVIKL